MADEHLISNKANIVRRAVAKEGLTLHNSVGVGDTEGDIPFLEMVEKPICFNPNLSAEQILLLLLVLTVELQPLLQRLVSGDSFFHSINKKLRN